MRTATSGRAFRLIDAMILTAATAAGCGVWRALSIPDEYVWRILAECFASGWWAVAEAMLDGGILGQTVFVLSLATLPWLLTWTPALLLIGLLDSRGRWRLQFTRPGLAAGCAAVVAMAIVSLPIVAPRGSGSYWSRTGDRFLVETMSISMVGGAAAAATWSTMFLGRRCRAEAGWADRLGRALGALWVLTGFLQWLGWCLIKATQICQFRARRIVESSVEILGEKILSVVIVAMPVVAFATLAVILGGMLARRSRFRRRARRPGMTAAVASAVAVVYFALPLLTVLATTGLAWEGLEYWLPDNEKILLGTRFGGMAVLASWTPLILGRRWGVGRGWLDHVGVALGILWVTAGLAVIVGQELVR